MSGRSPVIRARRSASVSACSLSIATTRRAGVRMRARAQLPQLVVGIAQDVRDPVAVRVERGPQPPCGLGGRQDDVEVGAAHAAVAHPLHVAAVRVERDRPADAVDQRLRVAVAVVGARDAVLVVVHPRDRRVVGAERRARQQQPEPRLRERLDRRAPPRRVLAHVMRLVGDQQRRPLGAAAPVHGRPRRHRRVRHRDAVPVARLRPGGVRPVRLQRDPVPRRVQRPLAADVGRRRDDGDARHAPLGEHPVGHVQAERGLAGGGRRGGEERLAGVVEDGGRGGLLPRAQRARRGPGRQGATRRGAGGSDLVRHRARQASQRAGRRSAGDRAP